MGERLSLETLLGLEEGSAVITYGVIWAKTGPDEWRCPFRMHVPENLSHVKDKFPWFDIRDSAWLATVATEVVFDAAEWKRKVEAK